MPTLPGDKLTGQIKAIRPDIPIIMATGFSEKIMERDLGTLKREKVRMKPLLMRDMAVAIRSVLDKR